MSISYNGAIEGFPYKLLLYLFLHRCGIKYIRLEVFLLFVSIPMWDKVFIGWNFHLLFVSTPMWDKNMCCVKVFFLIFSTPMWDRFCETYLFIYSCLLLFLRVVTFSPPCLNLVLEIDKL